MMKRILNKIPYVLITCIIGGVIAEVLDLSPINKRELNFMKGWVNIPRIKI